MAQEFARVGARAFEAVVVDEGQDFHELWWASLEWVFRDPHDKTCYYVFFDPNQSLYAQDPCLPEEFAQPYLLQENWWTTVLIAEHCASLVGHEPTSRLGAPMGDEPEVVQARSIGDAFREAGRRRDSAATIGRINSGRFRQCGALTSGARGRVC